MTDVAEVFCQENKTDLESRSAIQSIRNPESRMEYINCDLPKELLFSNTTVRTSNFPKVTHFLCL
jgi:hypothetical protein